MNPAFPIPVTVVLVATLASAVTDLWKFKVHNLITLPLLISGLLFHGIFGGPSEFLGSLAGMVFGFGILVVFYVMGGMGAGDVKLLAAVGAWLGMPLTFVVFLASSLAAGVYALVLVLACGRTRETWINLQIIWHRIAAVGRHLGAEDRVAAEISRPDRRSRVIPFAAMVATGLIALLVYSWATWAP